MARRNQTDPSRHTKRKRGKPAKSRRVGPSATERASLPRDRGRRNPVPKRPRGGGQPPGHVGKR
jgi:hypothetical protein